MKFKNLTPHDIKIITNNGEVDIPASGKVARAKSSTELLETIDGIDIVHMTFGEPIDLPEPQEDTAYIVSLATANAAKAHGRTIDDLYTTAETVRDDSGRIIGCKALARIE